MGPCARPRPRAGRWGSRACRRGPRESRGSLAGVWAVPVVLPAPSLQREPADSICRHLRQAPKPHAWHLLCGYPRHPLVLPAPWVPSLLPACLHGCSLPHCSPGSRLHQPEPPLPAAQLGHEQLLSFRLSAETSQHNGFEAAVHGVPHPRSSALG